MPYDTPLRFLLVEDNPRDVRLVREIVADHPGLTFVHESTLAAAATRARAFQPAVVLLDLDLPDSGGVDTLRALLSAVPDVPVVVLTGNADRAVGTGSIRAGAADYLCKQGLHGEALVRTLRFAVERAAFRAEIEHVRRIQAEKERLTALGTLVAGVAHEINNPLSYMQAGVDLGKFLLDDVRGADGHANAGQLDEFAKHLDQLGRGIETIARITRALRHISRAPGGPRKEEDLRRIIASVTTIASSRLPAHVVVDVDTPEAMYACVNEGEMAQVFLNLLINAGDAMSDRPGTVRLALRRSGGEVEVEVADDGPGIPPDAAARLFTPFFTTKPDGTGLGLSLSRRIVEDHGGSLSFAPTVPRGATFRVRLPLVPGKPSSD